MTTAPTAPKRRVILRLLVIVEDWIPAALIGVMAITITADVIMRYAFNHPLAGAGELSLFCMVWMVFLGSAAVSRRGAHICLDFFSSKFGHRGRAVLDLSAEAITTAVLVFVTFATIEYLQKAKFLVLPGTGISKQFITLAALVGLVLMAAHSIIHAVRAIRGFRDPNYSRTNQPIDEIELDDFDTRLVRTIGSELTGKQD